MEVLERWGFGEKVQGGRFLAVICNVRSDVPTLASVSLGGREMTAQTRNMLVKWHWHLWETQCWLSSASHCWKQAMLAWDWQSMERAEFSKGSVPMMAQNYHGQGEQHHHTGQQDQSGVSLIWPTGIGGNAIDSSVPRSRRVYSRLGSYLLFIRKTKDKIKKKWELASRKLMLAAVVEKCSPSPSIQAEDRSPLIEVEVTKTQPSLSQKSLSTQQGNCALW